MNKIDQYIAKKLVADESFTLTHRKIYILPTKDGYYFALTIILMLLTAINFSNNLVYFFTFILISLVLIAMFYTQFNLLGIKIFCQSAKPVFVGETMNIPIVLQKSILQKDVLKQTSNKLHHPIAIQIQLNSHPDQETRQITFSQSEHQIMFPISMDKRGYAQLPTMTISSSFPFGLFRAWSMIKLTSQSLVYPNSLKYDAELYSSSNTHTQTSGTKKGNDEFFGLSQYIQGSSLKKVHWKMVAKEQGMYLKDFVEGGHSLKQWFDIRDLPEHLPFEKKLSFLCFLIVSANQQSFEYGLKLYHQKTALASGEKHLHHCLSLLALAKP